jgi:hypothetical protein
MMMMKMACLVCASRCERHSTTPARQQHELQLYLGERYLKCLSLSVTTRSLLASSSQLCDLPTSNCPLYTVKALGRPAFVLNCGLSCGLSLHMQFLCSLPSLTPLSCQTAGTSVFMISLWSHH